MIIYCNFKNQQIYKARYQRNNKRSGLKNIRCYPFCLGNVHQNVGFCGSTIDIEIWASLLPGHSTSSQDVSTYNRVLNKTKLRTWGEFCLCDAVSPTKIGDIIDMKAALALERSKSNQFLPWYPGVLSDQVEYGSFNPGAGKLLASVTFSSQNKGWHYAWSSSKHAANSSHCFRVYVFTSFVNSDGDEMLQCVGVFNSPQFKIQSTRGASTGERTPLDFAIPIAMEENKSIYSPEYLHQIQTNIPLQQQQLQLHADTTAIGESSDDNNDQKGKKKRQIRASELTEAQLEDVKLLRLLSALKQIDHIKACAAKMVPETPKTSESILGIPQSSLRKSPDQEMDVFSGQLGDMFDFFVDELGVNTFMFAFDDSFTDAHQNPLVSVQTTQSSIALPNKSNNSDLQLSDCSSTTSSIQSNTVSAQSPKENATSNSLNELINTLEAVASYLIEEESFSKLLYQSLTSNDPENQRNKYQNVLKVFESHINEYLLRIGTTLEKVNKLLLKHGKNMHLDSPTSDMNQKRARSDDSSVAYRKAVRKVDIMRGEDPAVKASISGMPAPLNEIASKISASSPDFSSSSGGGNSGYGDELIENKKADILIPSEPHHILGDAEYHPTLTSPYFDPAFAPENGGDPDISGTWMRTSEGESNNEKLRAYRVMPWVTRKVIGAMEGKFKIIQPRKGLVKVFLKQKLLCDGSITYFLDGKERAFELEPPMPGDPPLAISKQSWAVGNAIFLRHYFTSNTRLTRIFWRMPFSPLLLSRYVQESYSDGVWKCDMVVEQISEPDWNES